MALPLAAWGAEMRSVDVHHIEGRYVMESEVWFAAGIEAVFAVFLDYDLSTQFSSAIEAARNIEPDGDGRRRFYIRNRGCVLLFCVTFERYGFVEHVPNKVIKASIDPDRSDFHLSNETWAFHREGDGTKVFYTVEFEPKFWVPPVIGPYVIKRELRLNAGDAVDRIEMIARGLRL